MLLALIVWIGGIIFFAFVLAPTLFGVLPTTKLAGDVVNATLTKLHWMGLVSGVIFLICSLLYNWQKHVQTQAVRVKPYFHRADAGLHDDFAIRDHATNAGIAIKPFDRSDAVQSSKPAARQLGIFRHVCNRLMNANGVLKAAFSFSGTSGVVSS